MAEEWVMQALGLVRIIEEWVMQALGLVRMAEEWVMQASGLVRISKNTKSTVSKTEDVLDGTSTQSFIGTYIYV